MSDQVHAAAQLYNRRFAEFGRDVRTVGWGSRADQELRFDVLLRGLDVAGKAILDIGCGLGDLIPYLERRYGDDFTYVGVDAAGALVDDARQKYGSERRQFITGDAFSPELGQADVVLLSGALSLKTPGIEAYAERTVGRMFALARGAACLNFLSSYVDYQLDKNQHYAPEQVFTWCRRHARRVNLFHDYPLYEFTVQLLR